MYKDVPCTVCNGYGFIPKFSDCSVWSETCKSCGGKGTVKEPVTNADRIRAMSDEELAELLISADFCGECEYCDKVGLCRYYEAHPDGVLDDGCKQAAINWLRQSSD